MLGIRPDEIQGSVWDSSGAVWNESERNILMDNLAARRPFLDFVYSRTSPEGVQQYLMVSGEPMFDSSGRFTGYRGTGKDVSETVKDNIEKLGHK
jgi:PAS domain-containing protein